MTSFEHPTVEQRKARGKAAREDTPLAAHEGWEPAKGRDPIALLEEQNLTREPDLVPVRHGRMLVSAFTFYRGAAKVMAADLSATPNAGLTVQLCGDAHLSNFGVFASPERTLLFDLNDFDETLPGPFEYDVKRMAASFTIAARDNGHPTGQARAATLASVGAYREAMAAFAKMRLMDIWYARASEQDVLNMIASGAHGLTPDEERRLTKSTEKSADKARTRDSMQALSKLAEFVDGQYRIVNQPPIVVPVRDLPAAAGLTADQIAETIHELFRRYRETLPPDRRHILEQFQVIDAARKVVGVGSVGTRAYIVLLQGRDETDPFFLQVKEATSSVLEGHLPASEYRQPGERVVQGQRMMQAASDIYLGWTEGIDDNRYLYWRQLRDMKGSAVIENMDPDGLAWYGRLCGWTLARAHARSGDPIAIGAYLGKKDRFDRAIADFATRYADQNKLDHEALRQAVDSGRLQAVKGV